LKRAAVYAEESGLLVAAGHGLHQENLARLVQQVPEIKEYNIGHAIVARAVFVGLEKAIKELKEQL
jgi:pyridoxine 5-phosphate synthase